MAAQRRRRAEKRERAARKKAGKATGKATTNGTGRKLRNLRLQSEERVVVVARPSRVMRLPRYLVSLGLYGMWRKRDTSVVTDRRILVGKGLVNRRERSIPLGHVDDAAFVRKGMSCYSEMVIETKRGRELVRVGPMSSKAARRFTAEIQGRL